VLAVRLGGGRLQINRAGGNRLPGARGHGKGRRVSRLENSPSVVNVIAPPFPRAERAWSQAFCQPVSISLASGRTGKSGSANHIMAARNGAHSGRSVEAFNPLRRPERWWVPPMLRGQFRGEMNALRNKKLEQHPEELIFSPPQHGAVSPGAFTVAGQSCTK